MINNNYQKIDHQGGYVLLGVLIFLAIGLAVTIGMLQLATGTLSTRKVSDTNTENFYEVERTINAVTAWLQSNSKNIVTAFRADNFPTNFDVGSPAAGTNEGTAFAVPTLIKMKGSNTAVQLTNSSFFGSSAFPSTKNIDTNADFDVANAFEHTNFGTDVNVRLLVVWAMQTEGHYEPIFRIDAVTGGNEPEHGVHGINFIKSSLVTSASGIGYYASFGDFATANPNNECWSYQYSWNASTSSWSRGAARSNCLILGQDDMTFKSAIHGNVMTNKADGIHLSGGSISGTKCQGPGCVTYTLPTNPTYAARCAAVTAASKAGGSLDINGGSSKVDITSGPTDAERCWRNVTIGSNKTINFATADQPYYIQNLLPQNNSNSVITFTTVGPGHKYTLYVDNLANGSINGNQLVATNLAPHQLEIFITTNQSLTLNGTAAMNAIIVGGESALFKHLGNFTFSGALRAGAVQITGNAVMGYDEDLGTTPVLSDINFTLYKASQRYR